MKHSHEDEGSLLTIIFALLIAVAILAVPLLPSAPAEIPQDVVLPSATSTSFVLEAHAQEAEPETVLIEVRKQTETKSSYEALADEIIDCESDGLNVEIIDTNGKWSRGVAQFQDATWRWMSAEAGVVGSSTEPQKAREVLIWALENELGNHWYNCYQKVTK